MGIEFVNWPSMEYVMFFFAIFGEIISYCVQLHRRAGGGGIAKYQNLERAIL